MRHLYATYECMIVHDRMNVFVAADGSYSELLGSDDRHKEQKYPVIMRPIE